ncbi:MAG: glycosyltransferase family 39 protein [Deltaproteobacteria bacterium]|nr:glycosyltransferase family 39 protein [Deltaproteobacteria bacterium]
MSEPAIIDPSAARTGGEPAAREMLEGDVVPSRPLLPINAPVEQQPTWQPDKHERRWRWAVLAAACLVFLPNLGAFGLWDPWETHYGAVTTEMLETYDWVSPWWGSRQQIGDEPKQGEPFYSKPIYIFWTEAVMARVIGRGEWAIRLPCALLAIMAVYLSYLAVSRIWTRRAGLLAAAVLMTSPFFFMVSRQAQTDMPFVATLAIAMCFLMLAIFGPRQSMADRTFMRWVWGTVVFVALNTLPQYGILLTDLSFPSEGSVAGFPSSPFHYGWVHALFWTLGLSALAFWFVRDFRRERAHDGLSDAFKDRWLRKLQLVAFYVFCAQSFYAKGLLGPLLPGGIILLWLLASWNWRVLDRVEVLRGIILFLCTGMPWYAAMLIKHGKPYFDRFFVHDHFNRIGSGVHQIDSGTFEHFIKWLGFGFFPWVAFVPLALFWLVRLRARDNDHRNQALLMVAMWALLAFSLFTYSGTKFHHYIFPAVPAIAIITALYLRHLVKTGGWAARFSAAIAVVFVVAVGLDIAAEPQAFRSLMTYKYDRPMPDHLPIDADAKVSSTSDTTWSQSYFWKHTSGFLQGVLTFEPFRYKTFIPLTIVIGAILIGLFFVAKTRKAALVGLGLLSGGIAAWSLNYYMPMLSPHWSQKYLFDAYYDTCTQVPKSEYIADAFDPLVDKIGLGFIGEHFRSEPKRVCQEDILAWLITWRGETYYSYNELKALAKQEQLTPYLEKLNGGNKVYVIAERGKASSIKSALNNSTKALRDKGNPAFADIKDWEVKVENDENLYFQTLSATPVR